MTFEELVTPFLYAIEEIPLVQAYAASYFWFPLIETVHVLSLTFLVGSIFFVDLRLMGFVRGSISIRRAMQILPYTWAAFGVAVVTGTLLYAVQASRYTFNFAFQIKFALLVLAGLNMAAFHFGIWRTVDRWDNGGPVPTAAKIAGFLSAAIWVATV